MSILTSRPSILPPLALFYALVAFVMTVLILISGSNSSILQNFYYLKTDLSSLNIPSTLANSTLLGEISSLSSVDLIGPDATARTLGLADTYTISLTSACGTFPGDNIQCTDPEPGYSFSPASDLRLSSTSMKAPDVFLDYSTTSEFLAAAYIISAITVIIAPIPAFFADRFPKGVLIGAVLASLSTLFLLAASIASFVVFPKTKDSFNAYLGVAGIETLVGKNLFILSFMATLFAGLCTSTLFLRAKAAKRHTNGRMGAVSMGSGGKKGLMGAHTGYQGSTGGRSLLLPGGGHQDTGFQKLGDGTGSDDGMEMDNMGGAKWRRGGGENGGTGRQNEGAYEPYSHAA